MAKLHNIQGLVTWAEPRQPFPGGNAYTAGMAPRSSPQFIHGWLERLEPVDGEGFRRLSPSLDRAALDAGFRLNWRQEAA